MSLAGQLLQEETAPRLVVIGPRILEVHQVDTLSLLHVGFAHLEGSQEVRAVEAEIRDEQQRARRERATAQLSPEQRAEAEAKRLAIEQRAAQARLDKATRSADSTRAIHERYEAYCCASIRRIGFVRPELQLPRAEGAPRRGLQGPDFDPAAVAVDLVEATGAEGDPVYLDAITVVPTQAEHDVAAGRVWVRHLLTPAESAELGMLIQSLPGVGRFLRAFRGRPGARADGGQDGAAMEPVADGGAPGDAARDGGHDGLPRAGDGGPPGLGGSRGPGADLGAGVT